MMMSCCKSGESWTKEQWLVVLIMAATHFANGMCVSLQAPFYPAEAEKKGVNATAYGMVFGIFELTVFIVSPIMGKYIPRFGSSNAFCCGIFITGATCIFFGFLVMIQDPTVFVIVSLVVRVIEAIGNAAFLTASFTLVAMLFPNMIASVFSLVEMFFGLGLILGPTLGGALYEIGGYITPFVTLGSLLVIQAIFSTVSFKKVVKTNTLTEETNSQGLMKALTIPRVAMANFSVFTASLSIGFLMATLERHLAQFDLSSMEVGIFFMAYGMAYAFPNPIWGFIADRICPRLVTVLGSVLLAVGFVFVGPLPVTGLSSYYNLSLAMLVVAGIGIGAMLVSGFTESQRSAVANGYPNDMTTYSLISSLWTSSFALGAFIGPTAAGVLYDLVGFRWSTLFGVCWNLVVTLLTIISILCSLITKLRRKRATESYSNLKEETGEAEDQESYSETKSGRKRKPNLSLNIDLPEEKLFQPAGFVSSPTGMRYTPTEVLFSVVPSPLVTSPLADKEENEDGPDNM